MLATDRGPADVRVRRQRAEADRVAIHRDAAQRIQPPQVEDPVGRRPELAGQGDHQVRASGDGAGRTLGHDRERVGELARGRDGRLDGHGQGVASGAGGRGR